MCGRKYGPDERYIISICHSCKKVVKVLYLNGSTLELRCPRCKKVWIFEARIEVEK